MLFFTEFLFSLKNREIKQNFCMEANANFYSPLRKIGPFYIFGKEENKNLYFNFLRDDLAIYFIVYVC